MKRSAIFLLFTALIIALFNSPVLAAPSLKVQINGSAVDAPTDMNVIEGQERA